MTFKHQTLMFDYKKFFLLILPLFMIVLFSFQKQERSNYHMYVTDPEYAYLFNGMNICNLASPAHVMGPGTPSQIISAVVIKTLHFFRFTSDPLNVDVMKNPDVYCSAINTFSFILLIIALIVSGLLVAQATQNIVSGIFIQLMPFTKWVLIDLNTRILVESVIIFGTVLLIAVMIHYINNKSHTAKPFDKYIVAISALIAFIASSKLVYLPIAILPFIAIGGVKRKLTYTISTFFLFLIFSFSIFFHWKIFIDWYIINFFHSGMYGSGEATIIDWSIFRANFHEIFINDKLYSATFITLFSFTILYFLPFLKLKKKNDKEFYMTMGIFATLIILTLLVSKQYKDYYLTVNLLLIVPSWYLMIKILSRLKPVLFPLMQITAFIILSVVIWNQGPKRVFEYHDIRMERDKKYLESLNYAEENFNSETPVLVLADYYGAPFMEYGLYYGMAYCGHKMAPVYAAHLNQEHPHIYFFHGWNKLFNQWGYSFSYIELLKKYQTLVFYSGDKQWKESLNNKFHGINRQIDTEWTEIKRFDAIGQTFWEVKYDSTAALIDTYSCNAETIDETGNYFINELGQLFQGAKHQTANHAKNGSFSIMLPPGEKGFSCSLSEIQKGSRYIVNVWRLKTSENNTALVVRSDDEFGFFIKATEAVASDDEWEKLQLDFVVPDNIHNKELMVYCINEDPMNKTVIDNFKIKKHNVE